MGLHFGPGPAPDDPEGPSEAELALARGLLAPAVLVMAADGTVNSDERRELIGSLRFNGLLRRLGAERVMELAEAMLVEMKENFGVHTLGGYTEALSPELRETAICMALRVATADGNLDDAEHTVLVDLAMKLGITPEAYNKMVDVVTILQRSG
ncbi:MAG: tellurite resistance TerB family protein [Pseudomonadota bacterium]